MPSAPLPFGAWLAKPWAFLVRHRELRVTLLDQALVSGSNFLLAILLTRILGLKGYGGFVLGWTAVLFFNSLQQALFVAPMMSLGAHREGEARERYFTATLLQQIVFAALVPLLVFLGTEIVAKLKPQWTEIAPLAGALSWVVVTSLVQDFIRRFYFARMDSAGNAFRMDVVAYCGQIAAVILLARHDELTVAHAYMGIGAAYMLSALYGAMGLRRIRFRTGGFWAILKENWTFSRWLGGASLLQWASGNLFLIAVGALLGRAGAGVLRSCQNLMGGLHVLFIGLENYLPPRMARIWHAGGPKELRPFLGKALLGAGAITVIVSLTVAVAPRFWLRLAYGDAYGGISSNYAFVLRWYAGIYLLILASTILRQALRSVNRTPPIFVSYVITAAFSLSVAFPLVREVGLVGALAGIAGTQILSLLYVGWSLRVELK